MAKSFSEQLRQLILECNHSQNELAKMAGIDQTQLNRFVNGKRRLSTDDLDAICKLLGARLTVPKREKQ